MANRRTASPGSQKENYSELRRWAYQLSHLYPQCSGKPFYVANGNVSLTTLH